MTAAATGARNLCWGALAALGALAWAAVPASADRAPARPNVVLIETDDQAAHTVRPEVMPSLLDLVAARGTTFTDAIVTTPLCCPSRAGLLSGQYGHNNGVLRNDYRQLRDKRNVLPAWLQRAGYATIHVGKFLNAYRKARGPEARPAPGWDVWQTLQEPNRFYGYELSIKGRLKRFGNRDRDYVTDVLSKRAARLVRRHAKRQRPFYLQLDHWAPHNDFGRSGAPCHGGADPTPAPRDETLFAAEPLPRPPSFNEEDTGDKPSFIRALPPLGADAVERNYRCALASLAAVDRGIERVHAALERSGELDDTVIVFTSDNGVFYGEHRLRRKAVPYEEALRVPLVISSLPRHGSDAPAPARVSEPVANIDLAPTILELAGAKPCRKRSSCRVMDGRSLMPLLRGREGMWPEDRPLAVEYTGRSNGSSSCSYRGIRTPGQIYVEHTITPNPTTGRCEPRLEVEHYDLRSDPFQLDNLFPAAPPAPAALEQSRLAERLATLRRCAGIAGRDPERAGRPHCE